MKYGSNQRDAETQRGRWLGERENARMSIDEQIYLLDDAWERLAKIKDMLTDALTSEAEQKQWYLCQIALLAGLRVDFNQIDGGVAPSQGKKG